MARDHAYDDVAQHAKANSHHGGRSMIRKVEAVDSPLDQGYYVCDEAAETFVEYFKPGEYKYALAFAEGYDNAF